MNATQQIFDLIRTHQWIPLAALIVGFVVRLLKSDTTFPITVPPALRSWLALALGAVSGVLASLVGGVPLEQAILGGLTAALTAIAGHDVVIESMRGGKEIPIPGLMKKPPTPPSARASVGLLFFGAIVMMLGGAVGCSSFLHFSDPSAQAVSCIIASGEMPVLDAAAALCGPFAPVCESLLETVFGDACTAAAAKGANQTDAHAAGLAAVREKAATMREQLNSSDAGAQ